MIRIKLIREHLWHWKQALMGPVVTICLLVYQQSTGKSPTWGLFGTIIFAGLAWQFWTELIKEKKRLVPGDVPELYLQFAAQYASPNCSGFFLRTENDRKAFNVRMSSEETVGDGHVRLVTEWERVDGPIGKKAVEVVARCVYLKDAQKHVYSANLGDQLNLYFEHKKSFPDELVVSVEYTDAAGKPCPTRKFKIWRERDGFKFQIRCEPLEAKHHPEI